MIPILFAPSATAFTSNGIGRLSDAIRCAVTEVRNGEFELEMEYPLSGAHFSDIRHSAIVAAVPARGRSIQAFRIYKISKPISGRMTVLARHISYQLTFIPVSPFSAQGLAAALAGFKSNAAEACPFTLSADFSSPASYSVPIPTSIRSYLGGQRGSILDIYGGEWEWDNYSVILHQSRGADRGVVLRYGKDITDLRQEENIANTYTGIYPYWQSSEGQTVTLPEKVIHASTASSFPFQRTLVKDFTEKFANAPTAGDLRDYTNAYIAANGIGVPAVGISLKFVDLADTEEYKDILMAQSVGLCDTVTVEFSALGVSTKAKVTKVVWDVLAERYTSIEVGDRQGSLSGTVEEQIQTVTTMPTTTEMQQSIDRATGVLGAGLRGHVVINRNKDGFANEILFLDNENMTAARNVIRINVNGIGFSTTGYGGPYANAWTIDGKLDADFIQAGSVCIGGSYTNKDGSIEIRNAKNEVIVQMNQTGVTIKGGALSAPTISGGSIKIGQNFSVDSNGKMKASSGEFTGAIRGGSININNGQFLVDSSGKMTAQNGRFKGAIQGGSININNNFLVNSEGRMTAKSGTFSGNITGGTINIGKGFSVNSDGIMSATGGEFNGKIHAVEIVTDGDEGGRFSAGDRFHVDYDGPDGDYSIGLGKFEVYKDDTHGECMASTYVDSGGDQIYLEAQSGKIYCQDIFVAPKKAGGGKYSEYWTNGLGYWVDWCYKEILRLKNDTGGGDDDWIPDEDDDAEDGEIIDDRNGG